MKGVPTGWTRRTPTYALATLGLAVAAVAWLGDGERMWGIAAAWLIQVVAVWPLNRALLAGRRATRPWLGGIALRMGGLVVMGGLAWTGSATPDLPIAYGLAMLVLLWTEALWLALARAHTNEDQLDTERTTG
ncbi:MAG: hypothetical protein F4164_00115 [Gemmatimonadales bacterium]|nr:hypothetical protein [Gemmatimonadales bacterium]MYG47783.1 hypothetical protein [Gemmatimonadales bacterium]MYK01165.1 hypothetical protein [Candidatus Palauibacter ramosifaciens]